MKKVFKTLFAVAAVAVGTLLFSGADSEAATTFNANLQQTDFSTIIGVRNTFKTKKKRIVYTTRFIFFNQLYENYLYYLQNLV